MKKITEQELKVLQDLANIKGVENCIYWRVNELINYPYIDREALIDDKYLSGNSDPNKAISFNDAIKYIADIEPIKKVVLNGSYTAIVKNGFVEVGCQKISFDKVKELYEAIKE